MHGYRDDHLHLLACAAARRSIDVRGATTIGALLETVARATGTDSCRDAGEVQDLGPADCPAASPVEGGGGWLRVWGYDDALLHERRHPTVAEFDEVTEARPAVLHHITGHVAVVNSAAARALGLDSGGVLTEGHDVLARVPRASRSETVRGVSRVLADMAAAGITACTDATHTNDLSALELLAEAAALEPSVEVTAMVGADRLASLRGLPFGAVVEGANGARDGGRVRIGHAKVMPGHDDDGSGIDQLVKNARRYRFPVAIHAMDIDTLDAALDALEAHRWSATAVSLGSNRSARRPGPVGDRIEHCALALPEQLDRISRLGVNVVTQPSFVTRRARKYREQLSAVEQAWLWPLNSLLRRGIRVTFSSDAPTVPADPAEWISAATSRDLAAEECVDLRTARLLSSAGR